MNSRQMPFLEFLFTTGAAEAVVGTLLFASALVAVDEGQWLGFVVAALSGHFFYYAYRKIRTFV